MNRKRIARYCCAALVAAGIGLNIQNATANYGISENKLALMAVGGSNSASGTILIGPYPIVWFISVLTDDSTTPKPDDKPKKYACKAKTVVHHENSNGSQSGGGEANAGNGTSGGGAHGEGSSSTSHEETYTTQEYRCTSASGTEATYSTLEECKKSDCEK